MLMSATALLERNPRPSEEEIRRAIQGNICRCTGYVNIVRAIQAASGQEVSE
jgi:carbon-monoxide dehydrogenase small subunit